MNSRAQIIGAFVLVLLQGVSVDLAAAQNLTLGVTWAVPDDIREAQRDLERIHAAGFKAVRSNIITTPELYILADSLGLALYQDLPVRAIPVSRLADTLIFVRAVVTNLIPFAHRFRSFRGIGLADLIDTSHPDACAYLKQVSEFVNERAPPDVDTYYTTRVTGSDRCQSTVDEVFIDLRDVATSDILHFLPSSSGLPHVTGIGALGTWTDLDLKHRGLNYPRSPESQARYIERALQVVSGGEAIDTPSLVFIHRWQDPSTSDDRYADIIQRRYGLHNSSGGPRPALEVASGFATGDQQVFAFPAGDPAPRGWMWMTVLGWTILAALGLAYATSPRLRHMVPRYFLSHAFYREAVVSGRESLVGESIVILFAVSAGIGMLMAVLLTEISYLPVFLVGRNGLSPELREFLGALLDQPWTLTAIVASAYALTAVAWTSTLSLLSRARQTLLPAQVMMLVIWPQWPLIFLLLISPAISTFSEGVRMGVASSVLAITVGIFWLSAGRSLMDFWRCSRISIGLLVVALVLHPVTLGLAFALFVRTRNGDAVRYLWELATNF